MKYETNIHVDAIKAASCICNCIHDEDAEPRCKDAITCISDADADAYDACFLNF
jgi:hypothetical protein